MSGANGSNISVSDKYRQRRTLLVLRIRDNQTRDLGDVLVALQQEVASLLSSEATPQASCRSRRSRGGGGDRQAR